MVSVEFEAGLAHKLVPVHIQDRPPSYFIFAGLVFTPATVPYLRCRSARACEPRAQNRSARRRTMPRAHRDCRVFARDASRVEFR